MQKYSIKNDFDSEFIRQADLAFVGLNHIKKKLDLFEIKESNEERRKAYLDHIQKTFLKF